MFLVSAHLSAYNTGIICCITYGFVLQATDTYVDQLQSRRPEIVYPNLSMTPTKTEILKNILDGRVQHT